MNPELAARTVRIMSKWEGVDFLMLAILPGILLAHAHFKVLGKHVEAMAKAISDVRKPMLVVLRTNNVAKSEEAAQEMQAEYQKAGFPVYRSVDAAARALVRLVSYYESRRC